MNEPQNIGEFDLAVIGAGSEGFAAARTAAGAVAANTGKALRHKGNRWQGWQF